MRPVAVVCLPEEQCILSSILPPPSRCPGAKILLCKVARASVLQTSKKETVYVTKACTVCTVLGTSLRWPEPEFCFQSAPQGGAESDFASHLVKAI
jgi:hypothetical protein